jgi:cell division septation protein DedD
VSRLTATVSTDVQAPPAVESTAQRVEVLQIPEEKMNEILEPKYTIQVASFKKQHNAEEEADKIREDNTFDHDVFVVRKGDYSIVCVGRFYERSEARNFSQKLISEYQDLLVRRL